MSFILKKTIDPTNKFSETNVTFEITRDDLTVDEFLVHFKDFLQACGYHLDGEILYQKEEDEA